MPRPARTQVDSYVFNDPSSAAMSLTTTAQGSSPGDGRITPIPTPELQKLYSHWRQLQEFDELQKQGSGPGSNDGENGFLRPPSPSQATTMSRSPSCASTTNSVTREITNMGISGSEERPQGTTTRRKQGRQGPLDSTDKARTAFVRKLRACGKCHRRKVKCVHYNFSLFEQAYQATKRMAPFAAQGPPFSSPNLSSPNRHTQQHDLMGVGNMDAFPSYIPALDQGDAHSDLEALLLQSQTQGAPVSTSPLYNFARTALCSSVPLTRNTANLPSSAGDRHVPIGRLVIRDDGQEQMAGTKLQQGEWECRFGDDGTAASDSGASGDICKQRYDDLSGLSGHFQFEHMPFHDPKFFPRCKECELHGTEDMWVVCWQCEAPREMEKWYFGNIRTSTPSLTSGVSVRVADQDGPWGFMNNSQSPNYQFNGPFLSSTGAAQIGNSSSMVSPGGGGGGGGRGGPGNGYRNVTTAHKAARQHAHDALSSSPKSGSGGDELCCSGGSGGGGCPYYAYSKEFIAGSKKHNLRHHPMLLRLTTPAGFRSFQLAHPTFLRLLILSLVTLVFTHGWLLSSSSSSSCSSLGRTHTTSLGQKLSITSSSSSAPIIGGHVTEISAICILVGLVGMWMVKHIRFRFLLVADDDEMRLRRQQYQQGQRRCILRDLLGIPHRRDLEDTLSSAFVENELDEFAPGEDEPGHRHRTPGQVLVAM